jgi:beta-lactamase superfamily II metal-dependent hydrolase
MLLCLALSLSETEAMSIEYSNIGDYLSRQHHPSSLSSSKAFMDKVSPGDIAASEKNIKSKFKSLI